jgi:RimJ/RimL family protein N-acetyltransferase
MLLNIPTLSTERLILRAHKESDLTLCSQMWTHPEVVQYTIKNPSTEAQTWRRMLSYLGLWNILAFGYWAVEEKKSGQYIGELGFADFKRGLDSRLSGIPEIGWALLPSAHKKGFAAEALKRALEWGDENLKMKKTVALIRKENLASLRVAEKLGYKEIFKLNDCGVETLVYQRESNILSTSKSF